MIEAQGRWQGRGAQKEKRNPFRFARKAVSVFCGSGWETASPLEQGLDGTDVANGTNGTRPNAQTPKRPNLQTPKRFLILFLQ